MSTPTPALPRLFAPLVLRGRTLRNRIVFSPHATDFVEDGRVSNTNVAYYEARAAGGAALVVIEQHAVHATAWLPRWPRAFDDGCIPPLARVAEAVHAYDTRVVVQLFYGGRMTSFRDDGLRLPFYAVCDLPDERFRHVPREMPTALVREVATALGDAAHRAERAGLDGVEFQAAFAYLPAQFLNPRTKTRTDVYGGSFENRLSFCREALGDIRAKTGQGFLVGMRVPADEMDHDGLTPEETIEACAALAADGLVDWFNLGSGSDTSIQGWAAAVPPAPFPPGFLGPVGRRLK